MFHRRRTTKTALLEQLPLFRGLSPRHLQLVEQHADQVTIAAGTTIADPRRLAREFVVVHEGILRVQRDGSPIERLFPGDFFGELSLLAHKPRTATVIAETRASLVVVEARSFVFLVETVPAIRRRVMERAAALGQRGAEGGQLAGFPFANLRSPFVERWKEGR